MTNLKTFDSFRFSKTIQIVGLKAEPKSFSECQMSYYDARCNEYLRQNKDLLFAFCRELTKRAYIFLQKDDEGKFKDYQFLAELAAEYRDDSPEIYIFALNGAFRNADNLEKLSKTRDCRRLARGFWKKIIWEKKYKDRWKELGEKLDNSIQELELQLV